MSTPLESTVQQVIELEHKVAELEHSHSVINHELYLANQKLSLLETKYELLAQTLRDLRQKDAFQDTPIDRPPHY